MYLDGCAPRPCPGVRGNACAGDTSRSRRGPRRADGLACRNAPRFGHGAGLRPGRRAGGLRGLQPDHVRLRQLRHGVSSGLELRHQFDGHGRLLLRTVSNRQRRRASSGQPGGGLLGAAFRGSVSAGGRDGGSHGRVGRHPGRGHGVRIADRRLSTRPQPSRGGHVQLPRILRSVRHSRRNEPHAGCHHAGEFHHGRAIARGRSPRIDGPDIEHHGVADLHGCLHRGTRLRPVAHIPEGAGDRAVHAA